MSLVRAESLSLNLSTPTLTSKALPGSATLPKSARIAAPSAPRIDYEPIYTALKAALGAHWNEYRESLGAFILGRINQDELSHRIDNFVTTDLNTAHLHNQLISAIHANAAREAPEPGVATFVSANDKPSGLVAKTVAGDAADQRLKKEIMQLPASYRHRIKAIQDEPYDEFREMVQRYRDVRTVKVPESGGFNKTNIELEIRKRYAQPLASETHELPDSNAIRPRIEPICYQEGLPSGFSEACPEFLEIALQTWLKEALTSIARKVRSNGPMYIKTHKYKRRLEHEEEMALRGQIRRDAAGMLPVEKEAAAKQRPLDMADLRLAFALGDPYLAHLPLGSNKVKSGRYERMVEARHVREAEAAPPVGGVNGVSTAALTNGVNGHASSDGLDPNDDFGWLGGSVADREALDGVLGDIMDVDQ